MNDGGPAFPTHTCDDAALSVGGTYTDRTGLSVRDWFAGMALQGLLAAHGDRRYSENWEAQFADRALTAYRFADAMLKEGAR